MNEEATLLEKIFNFLNSGFSSSLLGALAGAWAAQKIGDKAKVREDFEGEIRAINVSVIIASEILNNALALKEQLIEPIVTRFKEDREAAENYQNGRRNGSIPESQKFSFEADLNYISSPSMEYSYLKKVLYEKISSRQRSLMAFNALVFGVDSLIISINARNKKLDEFYEAKKNNEQFLVQKYFGFRFDGGKLEADLLGMIDSMETFADHVIFFSHFLCQDLIKHGENLFKKGEGLLHQGTEKVVSMDTGEIFENFSFSTNSDFQQWLDRLPTE